MTEGRIWARVGWGGLCRLGAAVVALHVAVCSTGAAPRLRGALLEGRPADPPAAAGAQAHRLAPVGEGLGLVWFEPDGASGWALRFSWYDGDAWRAPHTIAAGKDFFVNWADRPGLGEAPDGALWALWPQKIGAGTYAYGVALARSRDRGMTWESFGWLHEDLSEAEHGFVSLVVEPRGLRAVWLDGRETARGGPMELRSALLGDGAPVSRLLDDRVCDCCATAATRIGGTTLVAYRDRTEKEIRDIGYVRLQAGEPPVLGLVHADGWHFPACPVNGPAVAPLGRGAAVVWYSGAGSAPALYAAATLTPSGPFGPRHEVAAPDEETEILGRAGLVAAPRGDLVALWMDRRDEVARIRARRLTRRGTLGPAVTLATTSPGRRSGVPSAAALGDDLVLVWTRPEDETTRLYGRRFPFSALPAP